MIPGIILFPLRTCVFHRSFPPRAKPWLCMGYHSVVRGTQLHGLFLFPPLHFLTLSLLFFFPSSYAFSLKYYCSNQKLFTENSIIHQNALHDFGVVDNFSSKSQKRDAEIFGVFAIKGGRFGRRGRAPFQEKTS